MAILLAAASKTSIYITFELQSLVSHQINLKIYYPASSHELADAYNGARRTVEGGRRQAVVATTSSLGQLC